MINCFTAITDANKIILPCDKIYYKFKTDIQLYPGYESKCCCSDNSITAICSKKKPVAVITGTNEGFQMKCCGRK